MLNCTDLECILHHHHYYHHLHQLQHHLQDGHHGAVADPASEGDDVLHLLNSTDGELSGLSHVDAPISDSVYIVCGVLIAMVLVGLIIVLLAVTISKLRKREETNNNSLGHPRAQPQDGAKVSFAPGHLTNGLAAVEATAVVTTAVVVSGSPAKIATAANVTAANVTPVADAAVVALDSGTDSASSGADGEDEIDAKAVPIELLWWYPDNATYGGTKDTLVRELPCEVPQDSKGLRKNLRGKWKRLVKKKPEDTCSIPPELRDQLKQIYVY